VNDRLALLWPCVLERSGARHRAESAGPQRALTRTGASLRCSVVGVACLHGGSSHHLIADQVAFVFVLPLPLLRSLPAALLPARTHARLWVRVRASLRAWPRRRRSLRSMRSIVRASPSLPSGSAAMSSCCRREVHEWNGRVPCLSVRPAVPSVCACAWRQRRPKRLGSVTRRGNRLGKCKTSRDKNQKRYKQVK
jgi:hypothetical protein